MTTESHDAGQAEHVQNMLYCDVADVHHVNGSIPEKTLQHFMHLFLSDTTGVHFHTLSWHLCMLGCQLHA